MIELFLARYVYLFVLVLLAIGLYGVLAKGDLVKKVIGLTIFSTAIYIFFIEGSLQEGATAPVIEGDQTDPSLYVDPLPHLLILTAIVVGVGVVGVALSLLVRLYRAHGTLDEAVIARRIAGREDPARPASPHDDGPEGEQRGRGSDGGRSGADSGGHEEASGDSGAGHGQASGDSGGGHGQASGDSGAGHGQASGGSGGGHGQASGGSDGDRDDDDRDGPGGRA